MKSYQPAKKAPKKRCPYCRALFDPPARKRGLEIRFCCPDHRKAYHKLGALPFSKLNDRIEKTIAQAVQNLTAQNAKALVGIEDRARTFIKNELEGLWVEILRLNKDCVRTWEIKP